MGGAVPLLLLHAFMACIKTKNKNGTSRRVIVGYGLDSTGSE
jgi:hypothetical protein